MMMRAIAKLATLTTVLGLAASPALALPPQPPTNPGSQKAGSVTPSKQKPTDPSASPSASSGKPADPQKPGPGASLPAKARAYGAYCQDQSKQHVAGQTGTPFSHCVTAMAKLASGATASPSTACATMSKKHVAGEKGTPYSRCVAAGAKLLKDQQKP